MLTQPKHTPPHLLLDNTNYFITAAIYQKRNLLENITFKTILLELIQETLSAFRWELHHWVILDNHYHWMGRSFKGKDLPQIIGRIHSQSGYQIRQQTHCAKPVWWNYWDYCPRDESDYFTRVNYLLNNPIKHNYVNNLHDYPWSTFHAVYAETGKERLAGQFRDFPNYRHLVLHEAENDDY